MQCPIAYRQKALSGMVLVWAILVCCAAFVTLPATASEFSISPINLQFAPGARSAVVSISNTDQRPIRFQLSLVEWTQDANGADVYTPSDDLVFFPRQLTVRPGDKAVARVGPKHGVTGITKTIALDGRKYDIACGQIDIGNAVTPMTERMAQGVAQANGTVAPEPRMDVAHVGAAVLFMANLPLETNVLTMTIMATKMPYVGRG